MSAAQKIGYVELKSLGEIKRLKEIEQKQYGPTAWLDGKTPEAIAQEKAEAARKAQIHRLETSDVAVKARNMLDANARETFDSISKVLPDGMKSRFEPAKMPASKNISGYAHLVFAPVAKYPTLNADGTKDTIVLYISNATAEIGEKGGLPYFKSIPPQAGKTSADLKPMLYAYRRRVNDDGTLGPVVNEGSRNGDGVVFKLIGEAPVVGEDGLKFNPANKKMMMDIARHVHASIGNVQKAEHAVEMKKQMQMEMQNENRFSHEGFAERQKERERRSDFSFSNERNANAAYAFA